MDNTREKLIELEREATDHASDICIYHYDCEDCPGRKYGTHCRDYLKADHLITNGVTVQKWIPVTERLPDKDGDYLVIKDLSGDPYTDILGFAVDGDKICRFDLSGENNCFYYYYDGEYISTDNVTHWMPLPEPPKGE